MIIFWEFGLDRERIIGCCLAVASLLTLGYSVFELTCLPSALKSVDFTGSLLVFLCRRS